MPTKIKLTIELEKTLVDWGSGPQLAQALWNDFCEDLKAANIFEGGVKDKLLDHIRLIKSETVNES